MAYIDDRIAELKQRIAEKRAYQRMHKYASTWDYVAEGDRSGFDRMDAEEAAYHNMLAHQAQQLNVLKAQQDFTARENELNRINVQEIAKQNKANEIEAKKDEYIRGRNKAASVLNYYQQALSQDPNNIRLQNDVQVAKEDFDYYDRKLGGLGYDKKAVQSEQSNQPVQSVQPEQSEQPVQSNQPEQSVQTEQQSTKLTKEQINRIN